MVLIMPYDPTTQPYDEPSRHVDCADDGESRLPLQYEDGPDFCTVRDAQGRDFALTVQPDLMKAMEKALSEEIADFMRDSRVSMTELCDVIYEAGTRGTAGVAEAVLKKFHVTCRRS